MLQSENVELGPPTPARASSLPVASVSLLHRYCNAPPARPDDLGGPRLLPRWNNAVAARVVFASRTFVTATSWSYTGHRFLEQSNLDEQRRVPYKLMRCFRLSSFMEWRRYDRKDHGRTRNDREEIGVGVRRLEPACCRVGNRRASGGEGFRW